MTPRALDQAPARATGGEPLRFVAPGPQYDEFLRLLGEPVESTTKLDELWARPSPFRQPFSPRAR